MLNAVLEKLQSRLTQSTERERLYLLSVLAHSVTVGFRFIMTEPQIHRDKLYALNEVQHQITNRLIGLLDQSDEWEESDFAQVIIDRCSEGKCEDECSFAISQTLKTIVPDYVKG